MRGPAPLCASPTRPESTAPPQTLATTDIIADVSRYFPTEVRLMTDLDPPCSLPGEFDTAELFEYCIPPACSQARWLMFPTACLWRPDVSPGLGGITRRTLEGDPIAVPCWSTSTNANFTGSGLAQAPRHTFGSISMPCGRRSTPTRVALSATTSRGTAQPTAQACVPSSRRKRPRVGSVLASD